MVEVLRWCDHVVGGSNLLQTLDHTARSLCSLLIPSILLGGSMQNLLSKAVSIQDCYEWMELIGGPRRVLDKEALVDLFAVVRAV